MSTIEHVWDIVGLQLLRCGPPATTVDDLWSATNCMAVCSPATYPALSDSLPCLKALIAAHGVFTAY
ncbi:hypothetical protein J437_LFUL013452 [Ladona fulva]|uniref:Uncharacterized protein n=1 Tax=Ladona fulva TaxID=123851 RepID=A0A8K0KLU2_LADFU|nr:hypothetical protein J437_LFUL013452 [Ladona fulva]